MFINDKSKEINCKVVYFGPSRCGKSTSLGKLCESIQSDSKGQLISLSSSTDNTLYFDFIPLSLGKIKNYTVRLHLYTVPGEAMYDKNRRIISKGVDGIVFVVDSQLDRMEANLSSLRELKEIVRDFDVNFDTFPVLFQYNKRDMKNAISVPALRELLNPTKRPDIETIATTGDGLLEGLKNIGAQIFAQLKQESAALLSNR